MELKIIEGHLWLLYSIDQLILYVNLFWLKINPYKNCPVFQDTHFLMN